jgi:maltose/moltooligosaccharide transporter
MGKYDGDPLFNGSCQYPKERYGVYMGIINMMIVIPMIFQNVSFGFILKFLKQQ